MDITHSSSTDSKSPKYTSNYAMARLGVLQLFIDKNIKRVGMQDKVICETRIRASMNSEFSGPPRIAASPGMSMSSLIDSSGVLGLGSKVTMRIA